MSHGRATGPGDRAAAATRPGGAPQRWSSAHHERGDTELLLVLVLAGFGVLPLRVCRKAHVINRCQGQGDKPSKKGLASAKVCRVFLFRKWLKVLWCPRSDRRKSDLFGAECLSCVQKPG